MTYCSLNCLEAQRLAPPPQAIKPPSRQSNERHEDIQQHKKAIRMQMKRGHKHICHLQISCLIKESLNNCQLRCATIKRHPCNNYANKILLSAFVLVYCMHRLQPAFALLETPLTFDQNRLELLLNGVPLSDKLSPYHKLAPDAFAHPPEFIRSRHFVCETHHVITKDNYILTMFRIVNPLVPGHLRHKLKPILLQHGLFTSAFNFIIGSDLNNDRPRFDPRDITRTWPLHVYTPQAPFSWGRILEALNDMTLARLGITLSSDRMADPQISESLGFELANQGYDVWMGNSRGSTYSLNHTHFDPKLDWRYWDFSFHEIALFDIPAQIDYVLQVRQRKSLAYVGHSQGNLVMFILQSIRPNWAHKVKPFIALSPIAYIPNIYFGAVRFIFQLIGATTRLTLKQINRVLKGQLLPKSDATSNTLDLVCVPKWTTPICDLAMTIIFGDNFKRSNDTQTPIIGHHIPEGTSILNLLHFAQMVTKSEFRTFDFGPEENKRRYGSEVNPFYPIQNIQSPDIAFISGRTDTLSTVRNVELTRKALRVPLLDDYVVPEIFWGHADHMYAIGAGRLVNAHLIGVADRFRLID